MQTTSDTQPFLVQSGNRCQFEVELAACKQLQTLGLFNCDELTETGLKLNLSAASNSQSLDLSRCSHQSQQQV